MIKAASADPRATLTKREIECLHWSAAGKTAWEVGQLLGLSEWTIVYHLERTKKKFGVRRKCEAIGHAVALGLIGLPTARMLGTLVEASTLDLSVRGLE
ncbi:MAG: helix-turn-helix transcriptional regulator [Burkholderiales bacterium]|jgi:DNA-binding CsgD family transcriptional regulator|nr:helix-turn-helix transcriptional regulator [Burkholderiales bacterium]